MQMPSLEAEKVEEEDFGTTAAVVILVATRLSLGILAFSFPTLLQYSRLRMIHLGPIELPPLERDLLHQNENNLQ